MWRRRRTRGQRGDPGSSPAWRRLTLFQSKQQMRRDKMYRSYLPQYRSYLPPPRADVFTRAPGPSLATWFPANDDRQGSTCGIHALELLPRQVVYVDGQLFSKFFASLRSPYILFLRSLNIFFTRPLLCYLTVPSFFFQNESFDNV